MYMLNLFSTSHQDLKKDFEDTGGDSQTKMMVI
jgi:hypothetical protein